MKWAIVTSAYKTAAKVKEHTKRAALVCKRPQRYGIIREGKQQDVRRELQLVGRLL